MPCWSACIVYTGRIVPKRSSTLIDFFLRHYAPGSWMTEAYAQRLDAWSRWNPPDLAEAFGVKRDSKKVPEARRRQDLRWPIVSAIVEYRRQKDPGRRSDRADSQRFQDERVVRGQAVPEQPRDPETGRELTQTAFSPRREPTRAAFSPTKIQNVITCTVFANIVQVMMFANIVHTTMFANIVV